MTEAIEVHLTGLLREMVESKREGLFFCPHAICLSKSELEPQDLAVAEMEKFFEKKNCDLASVLKAIANREVMEEGLWWWDRPMS
jgi:hypothetical protein